LKIFQKFRIPYVVAVRNTDVNVFFKKLFYLRKLGVEILKNSSKIIFLSKTYKDFVLENYVPSKFREYIENKCVIIPNGIDDYWVKNLGEPKELQNGEKIRILQVGDINKNKNVLTTVKAISHLNQDGFTMELNLVGKIVDKRVYNSIIKYKFVNYLGYKSKDELLGVYSNNHIFVLPSIYETFGLVYAEAMSQGLPVIYSKGQGFDGQFKNGEVGYATESLDITDLQSNLRNIIKNYDELSKLCLLNVKKFEWDVINESYQSLYEDVVSVKVIE
jgi:glycosyltransferase involved in cell wall biosynthesis